MPSVMGIYYVMLNMSLLTTMDSDLTDWMAQFPKPVFDTAPLISDSTGSIFQNLRQSPALYSPGMVCVFCSDLCSQNG